MKKLMKTAAIVMAMAIVAAGCGGKDEGESGGGAKGSASKEVAGKFFKITMPGEIKKESEEIPGMGELTGNADDKLVMTAYMHETETEQYAVVEIECEFLTNYLKNMDPEGTMKGQVMTEIIGKMTGGNTSGTIVDVGDQKGVKLSDAHMDDVDLSSELGEDAQSDIYVVPTDQVIFLVVYGAANDAYKEENGTAFFKSFKAINTTTDYMDPSVVQ